VPPAAGFGTQPPRPARPGDEGGTEVGCQEPKTTPEDRTFEVAHPRETRAELDVRTNTPASGRARTAVAQPWRTRDLSGDRLPVADELSKIFELAVQEKRAEFDCRS